MIYCIPFVQAHIRNKAHEISVRKSTASRGPVEIDYVAALEVTVEKCVKVKVTYVFNRINRLPYAAQTPFLCGVKVPPRRLFEQQHYLDFLTHFLLYNSMLSYIPQGPNPPQRLLNLKMVPFRIQLAPLKQTQLMGQLVK